jgi:hypothetical protein
MTIMEEENVDAGKSLLTALVRTAYQVQVTKPDNIDCDRPIAYGAGFMVRYKNVSFFVTADHNVHLDDYDQEVRTGVDNVVSIFNNISDKSKFETVITPLGGFYYMEKFDISKEETAAELVDVTVCILEKKHFEHHFLTDDVWANGEIHVKSGQRKIMLTEELLVEPNTEDMYFIYGKVKPEMKGLFLDRVDTLKEGLKFISKVGDYLLFNAPEMITDKKDWAGLSGSAVQNDRGECVGVMCSVNEGTNSFFVKPINEVKLLMDIAIQQEFGHPEKQ